MKGSISESIDGKSSGVAEQVEHIASPCHLAAKIPVLPLVKEKAGLLAFGPIDIELVTILEDHCLIVGESFLSVDLSVHKFEARLERSSAGTLVIDSFQ